jgi:hypothetical protein
MTGGRNVGEIRHSAKTLKRLRGGPSGPYMDGFAAALERDGYSQASAIRYLRAAAHLGYFPQEQGKALSDIDSTTAETFSRHLLTCHCPIFSWGRKNHHPYFGAKRYRDYLLQIGICHPVPVADAQNPEPPLVISFRQWLEKHRGAAALTIKQYCRGAVNLMIALGADPSCWNATGVRAYFLERADQRGMGNVEKLITSLRMFLRYLSVQGQCQADLDKAIPSVASWRLAALPRYLSALQLASLIAACDGSLPQRHRDRAILLLLLARPGLRAGDVAQLRIADIEWETGTPRVISLGYFRPLSSQCRIK